MQCTAAYPTDWKDMNLNVIQTYRKVLKTSLLEFLIEAGIQATGLAYMLGARVLKNISH